MASSHSPIWSVNLLSLNGGHIICPLQKADDNTSTPWIHFSFKGVFYGQCYFYSRNSKHQLIKTSLLFGSAPKHAILRVNRKQGEIIKRGLVARTGGVKHLGFAPSSSLLVLQPTPRSTGKKGDKHFNLSSCLILLFTARLSPSWPWKHLSSTNLTEWSAWKPFGQFIKEEC